MRMKILGAAVLALGLGAVGCSSSSSSSSSGSTSGTTATTSNATTTTGTHSTGSSGSNTTTTSTSTGSTGNGSGSTNGNNGSTTASNGSGGSSGGGCGTCAPGETCTTFGSTQACACSTPNIDSNAQADTCANNTNQNTVCDQYTLHCRGPEEYEAPAPLVDGGIDFQLSCDQQTSFVVNFVGAPYADGGYYDDGGFIFPDGGANSDPLCMIPCNTNDNCSAGTFCRLDSPLYYILDDGGVAEYDDGGLDADPSDNPPGTAVSFCDISICGPLQTNSDGSLANGDYFDTCNAHATGDGTCLPILANGYAQCVQTTASAAPGDACNPDTIGGADFDNTNGCAADSMCYPTSYLGGDIAPQKTGTCLPMCNGNAKADAGYNVTCPSVNGQQLTCQSFNETLPGNLKPGICD